MAHIPDGGPAFPQAQLVGEDVPVDLAEVGGMSLRDAFAIAALPTLMRMEYTWTKAMIAQGAYGTADAMLAERAKAEGR